MRIDTAAYAEGVIPPYYDSLIEAGGARQGSKRSDVAKCRALEMFVVQGIYDRFRFTARFWPTRSFAPAMSIRDLLNGFLRDRPRQRPRRFNP